MFTLNFLINKQVIHHSCLGISLLSLSQSQNHKARLYIFSRQDEDGSIDTRLRNTVSLRGIRRLAGLISVHAKSSIRYMSYAMSSVLWYSMSRIWSPPVVGVRARRSVGLVPRPIDTLRAWLSPPVTAGGGTDLVTAPVGGPRPSARSEKSQTQWLASDGMGRVTIL